MQIHKWVINDSILPKADPRGEQAVLVLTVAQTDLVVLHLSYYTMNLSALVGKPSLKSVTLRQSERKEKQLKSIQINCVRHRERQRDSEREDIQQSLLSACTA